MDDGALRVAVPPSARPAPSPPGGRPDGPFPFHGHRHETHLPAEQDQARPHARLPRPVGHSRRPCGARRAPPQGARPPERLNAPVRDAAAPVAAGAGGERPDGGARFGRDARLLDGKAFAPVFRRSRRFADRYWTVLVHDPDLGSDGERASGARLGLAIAKKRARRAVERNRIKRVARESFRHRRTALGARHVVVMNRDAAATAGRAELRAALDTLWDKVLRTSRA